MVCNPQREVIFCIGPDYLPTFPSNRDCMESYCNAVF